MSDRTKLHRDAMIAEADTSRSYEFALLLSRIFHPILLNVLMFVLVGVFAVWPLRTGLTWAAICLLAQTLPPTIFFTIRQRQGAYSDEDVSVRQQRNELYVFSLVTVLLGLMILPPLGLPRPFVDMLIAALLLGVGNGLVNIFWKISAHGTAIAALAMLATLYSIPLGIALWVCALFVGWARVRTHNHTAAQVLAGFLAAIVAVVVAFILIR